MTFLDDRGIHSYIFMGDEATDTLVMAVVAEWILQVFFDLILPDDEPAAASIEKQ